MADDIEDHSISYAIGSTATFSSMFLDLIKQHFFPNVAGNDVVWVLNCECQDLITWKTKENKFFSRFDISEPVILDSKGWKDIAEVYFTYYSPPAKRARHIYEIHDGKKFHIWHEGFMPEYESYNISGDVEKEWEKALRG